MIKIIQKIIYEPLFSFLIIGLVIYSYFLYSSTDSSENKTVVKISKQVILKEYKNLNKEQLDAVIANRYYEKILLNEAYSLGLEKEDKEISEKLLKKMNFIISNTQSIKEPSEEELYKYYKKNIVDYSNTKSISFSHVYFTSNSAESIEKTLELLRIANVVSSEAASFGDTCTLANNEKNLNFTEMNKLYGKYFTSKVFRLKQGVWHKPIHSKLGIHLVYINSKDITTPIVFDEVQDRVYDDYMAEQIWKIKTNSYKSFSSQYILAVEE